MINQDTNYISKYINDHCPKKKNITKRLFDIAFSLFAFVFFSPIFFILMMLVKISSKGPIFFASKRIGAGGEVIYCWKFRTMFEDSEEKLNSLLASSEELKKEWFEHYKLKNDPRITKIGSLLRKTSLDELPQFYNVLRGDLSVVGPRPLSLAEVLVVIERGHAKMFSVRPGITGIWQTSGRNLIPFERRIMIEEEYVEKQSLLFDVGLILKTIPMMIFPKGAF